MGEQVEPRRHRAFWARLSATIVVVSVPLAYGLVVQGVRPVSIGVFAVAAALALLLIWDGSRLLPRGVVWWARPEPLTDVPTGVYNPAGWMHLLEVEEDRCRRYGLPASVIALELEAPEPSEDLAPRLALLLQGSTRGHDPVACIDPASYAVLAVNADADQAAVLAGRLREKAADEGFTLSSEIVAREESLDLQTAWQLASGNHQAERFHA